MNFPRVYDDQGAVAVYIIKACLARDAKVFEVTKEAEEAWVQECISKSLLRKSFSDECTPGGYWNRVFRLPQTD